MAESAVRAGYRVTAVDGFGDLDTVRVADRVLTPSRDLRRPYSVERLTRLSRSSHGRARRLRRQSRELPRCSRQTGGRTHSAGQRTGRTSSCAQSDPPGQDAPAPPTAGSGRPHHLTDRGRMAAQGTAIGGRARGEGLDPGSTGSPHVLPAGADPRSVPASIVFAADGERILPLALSRQLIGVRWLGASTYWYSGNILAPLEDPHLPRGRSLFEQAEAMAQVVARACGLRG